jgi:hypothetical protein
MTISRVLYNTTSCDSPGPAWKKPFGSSKTDGWLIGIDVPAQLVEMESVPKAEGVPYMSPPLSDGAYPIHSEEGIAFMCQVPRRI